ncbi:serine/arginine repetitive matrix protein 1-like [Panicum virgatum]|uniref:serine/arginine repetitive matrix protein 1-like n=1 Tax=Panicum virgatum TaxID=38727 RepID=UPI0019D5C7BA|nr:serine/arginine repetitive matrix protein 1-like [Panicum virgatum]
MAVAIDFVHHNIEPLKDRVHPAFYYHGLDDPTRETTEDIPPDEDISRIRTFFAGPVTNIGAPRSFSIYNPPPESAANKPKRRTRRATAKRSLSKAIAEQDTREKNPKKPRHEYRAPPTSDTSSESGNPKLERRENPKESESVGGRVPTPPPSPRPSSAQEHAEADTQVTASGSKPVEAPKPKPVPGQRRQFAKKVTDINTDTAQSSKPSEESGDRGQQSEQSARSHAEIADKETEPVTHTDDAVLPETEALQDDSITTDDVATAKMMVTGGGEASTSTANLNRCEGLADKSDSGHVFPDSDSAVLEIHI